MLSQNKRLIGIMITVAVLLLVPFIAMQFSSEVNWSPFDFGVAAILLIGTGLCCEIVMRKVRKREHRFLLLAVILAALFLIWAELAVGIFGTALAGS